jgi:hypothetical protein
MSGYDIVVGAENSIDRTTFFETRTNCSKAKMENTQREKTVIL